MHLETSGVAREEAIRPVPHICAIQNYKFVGLKKISLEFLYMVWLLVQQ